jgi:alanine racemase
MGYADGVLRALSNGKGKMLVGGKLRAVLGRICMDMLMLDVTEEPYPNVGDEVIWFGHQQGAYQSIRQVAADAQTIPYEVLTRISPRVRRIYEQE